MERIEREWEKEEEEGGWVVGWGGGARTSQIKRGGLECGVCERTGGRGELGWENEGDGLFILLLLGEEKQRMVKEPSHDLALAC